MACWVMRVQFPHCILVHIDVVCAWHAVVSLHQGRTQGEVQKDDPLYVPVCMFRPKTESNGD